MNNKYLVFGKGLLGSAFLPKAVVLSSTECDTTKKSQIIAAINRYKPDVVINCAGIVPKNTDVSIEQTFKVNAFAPHSIADACSGKIPFVHISTDCVFGGEMGKYNEYHKPNATTVYGMSKILGEPVDSSLVVRTSFVGLPDPKGRGLLAWASQQTEVVGYDKVFWNGMTTIELIQQIKNLVANYSTGIRHLYSYTVSKYELLRCAKEVFGWNYTILPESDNTADVPHIIDRTLTSVYATGFNPKPIRQQLQELKNAR